MSFSTMKRKRNNFAVRLNIVEINDKNATLQARLKIITCVETLIKMYFYIYTVILWGLKYSMISTK